jgi:hypothetical protein
METESTSTGSSPVERVVSLRPCPFCGGKAQFNFWLGDVEEIYCTQCLCSMKFRCEHDWMHESAMQWNQRVPDTQANA